MYVKRSILDSRDLAFISISGEEIENLILEFKNNNLRTREKISLQYLLWIVIVQVYLTFMAYFDHREN